MKPHLKTTGIVLKRTNYGEADRIIVLLTPDAGKLHLIAKGVRKSKSKLAGGIELFSNSYVSYIQGNKGLNTLISSRLIEHHGDIVKDINRTMLGYELMKLLDVSTEDHLSSEYYHLLNTAFSALNDGEMDTELIREWFIMQLLKLDGHRPNLESDGKGNNLRIEDKYNFDIDAMSFVPHPDGRFTTHHIKFFRLSFSETQPQLLQRIVGVEKLISDLMPLCLTMRDLYIRL